MREIKFRGKRVDDSEWVYGSLLERKDIDACHSSFYIVEMVQSTDFRYIDDDEVDAKTVGQFTGLKDKNGREIYEGDIVNCGDGFKYVVKYTDEDVASCGCCYGEFSGIGFVGEEVSGELWCGNKVRCQLNSECEVVGNIWDNPELLKKESER